MSQEEVLLTPKEMERLEEELAGLRKNRPIVAEQIRAAREFGDLSENAEYQSAKETQAQLEARIAQIEETLRRARIVRESTGGHDVIRIGSKVRYRRDHKEMRCVLVSRADPSASPDAVSVESPFGKALLGHHKGDKVQVQAPGGVWTAEIIAIG